MKLVFDLCQSTIQKPSVFRLFQAMEKPPIWDIHRQELCILFLVVVVPA